MQDTISVQPGLLQEDFRGPGQGWEVKYPGMSDNKFIMQSIQLICMQNILTLRDLGHLAENF